MVTVSEWLMNYLRSCPHFPEYPLYNSIGEAVDSLAIIENTGDMKKKQFVNGSQVATLPFMLLVRVNQSEADEIKMQQDFSKVIKWITENDPANTVIDDGVSVMSLEVVSNLVPETRDDSGNIQYMALFTLTYFQRGEVING